MTDKIMYWVTVLFSGLAVLLIIVNMAVVSGNRTLDIEVKTRQMAIDTAARLSQLNQNLAQALAEASVKNDDQQIRDLLTSQGISIKSNKDANATAAAKKK